MIEGFHSEIPRTEENEFLFKSVLDEEENDEEVKEKKHPEK